MINCEIELELKCQRNCVLIEEDEDILSIGFTITSTKFHAPRVTSSIKDNINFLKNINEGFKISISWNYYRPEVTTQKTNNNLHYLIEPTFRNISRLFEFSFKNDNRNFERKYFCSYYMPLIETKDFNALIDDKPFFD